MVLEKGCLQKMEEKYFPTEEKKEDGSLPFRIKYIKSNKYYIIKRKSEISNIFKNGKVYYTKDLKIIYIKNEFNSIRFIPCVSKKWGKSYQRNRFKRLIREAMWKIIKELQNNTISLDIAMVANSNNIKDKNYKLQNLLPQIYSFLDNITHKKK